jgi:vacuolar-type H+-ATPase subunit H
MNLNQALVHWRNLAVHVADMRRLQKKYFKTRDIEVLKECRKMEIKVDKLIESYKPSMFKNLDHG